MTIQKNQYVFECNTENKVKPKYNMLMINTYTQST